MKTYSELLERWNLCNGGQLLVDHQHPLKLYLNVNEAGNRELLVPVSKPIYSFRQTEAISVKNYKNDDVYFFGIELVSQDLEKEYVSLCFDLIESSRHYGTKKEALNSLLATLKKWYELMANMRRNILSEKEIRGLMGELKFILDQVEAGNDGAVVVSAWTVHEDAERDFIFDDSWNEIKTVRSSSDYIMISSLEQLQHDSDGRLTVYTMDRTTNINEGYTIPTLIEAICSQLDIGTEHVLNKKLLSKGYKYREEYDQYRFLFKNTANYIVNESFPRISRPMVSDAVRNARYELYLKGIESWREANGTGGNTSL